MKKFIALFTAALLAFPMFTATETVVNAADEENVLFENVTVPEGASADEWHKKLEAAVDFREHYTSSYVKLAETEHNFEDIENHWAKSGISDMYKAGIVNGVSENSFDPESEVTRAEFITMVMRMSKIKTDRYKEICTDIAGDEWYAQNMWGAYNAGIIPEFMMSGGMLKPNQAITREEMAAVSVGVYEYLICGEAEKGETYFSDSESIKEEAKDYVAKAKKTGLVNGHDDGSFAPSGHTTRAEAAVLVLRIKTLAKQYMENDKTAMDNPPKVHETATVDYSGLWKYEPVILNVTDAIKPGYTVMISGEGFIKGTYAAIVPVNTDEPSAEPPEDAVICETALTDEEENFISFIMPEDIAPGAYYVWAKNKYGWSKPAVINGARTLWVAENVAGKGQTIKVAGRNFNSAEFGADTVSAVALTDGTKAYKAYIRSADFYDIEFVVPYDIPEGDYTVMATNDGYVWTESADGRPLKIKDEVYDPIELGVGWADEFVWDNIIIPENLNGDGKNDDSKAIQAALDKAGEEGGGVVYLKNGTYLLNNELYMPAKTVLAGESRNETIVTYGSISGISGKCIINMKGEAVESGRAGLFRMTLTGDKTITDEPDIYIWFGHPWDERADDASLRTADYYFMKDINLEMNFARGSGRNMGVVPVMRDHLLVTGCNFSGEKTTVTDSRSGDYTIIVDCDSYTLGGVFAINGERAVYEDCDRRFADFDTMEQVGHLQGRQGFFVKGLSHVENNTIIGTRSKHSNNVGEIICTEEFLAGEMMGGKVISSEATSLQIEPAHHENGTPIYSGRPDSNMIAWNDTRRTCGEIHISIVGGRGMGQVRRVKSLDKETKTCTIDKPWNVIPDSSSDFIVWVPSGQWSAIYKTTAVDCGKGLWVYRGAYDTVVTDNNLTDTNGVQCVVALTDYTGMDSFDTGYFIRLERNNVKGGCRDIANGAYVGFHVTVHSGKQLGKSALVYGAVIRDNNVHDIMNYDPSKGSYEAGSYPGFGIRTSYQSGGALTVTSPLVRGSIIEYNRAENVMGGQFIGGSQKGMIDNMHSGTVSRKNTTVNCTQDILIADNANLVLIP